MDELKIIWSNTAIKQRNNIFEYWNKRNKSKEYSIKLNKIIYKKLDLLKTNPQIGILGDMNPYRVLYFENYSLVYKENSENIYIAAFWDQRQNPNKSQKLLGL